MSRYIRKVVKKGSLRFSYWTNNTKEYRKIYVLLPPGAESGKFFKNIIDKFGKDDLVISLDYPGRGLSTPIKNNDVASISIEINRYLKALNLPKKIYLVGLSYGTAIAMELVKISVKPYKEVILIAPGEFIDKKYHLLIKVVFIPAKLNETVRKFYRYILVKYLPDIFAGFPKKNLKSILYQWLGIIRYRIDENFICDLPCTILAFSHDQIIRKGSILKVKKIFPNSVILLEIKDHHLNISDLSKRLLKELLA